VRDTPTHKGVDNVQAAMSPAADVFTQKVEGVAYRTKPSWYIVGKNDHTVNPELKRSAAERMGATTYEFETSHVPMLSRPDLVLDVVRTAANAVQESLATA
jgi:pimeloyl-ACP methyl ester carboxylesterase